MKKWSLNPSNLIVCGLLCMSHQLFAQANTPRSNPQPYQQQQQPIQQQPIQPNMGIGIVNFRVCVEESKLGKAEQVAFENLKNQMAAVLEKTEKDLEEVNTKLNDPEQLDALSSQAEEELKTKFQRLSQEMNRYQTQYYQILNQANYKVINSLQAKVADAAQTVAKARGMNMVLNEEAFFYYSPDIDITKLVIAELDRNFTPDDKATSKLNGAPLQSPGQAPR